LRWQSSHFNPEPSSPKARRSTGKLNDGTNLAASAGWTTSSYSISTANGTNSTTITPAPGNLFFRLSNPQNTGSNVSVT
jgi:hypothetical protein